MKKFVFIISIISVLAFNLSLHERVLAQESTDYTVLAPLPGTTLSDCPPGGTNCKADLVKSYLPGIFNLAIGISAAFAVVVIVYGGFQYMSTDALQGKEDGKKLVWNAVKGLVLVICAYLILYTVNPKLLEFNLNIEPVPIKPAAGGTVTSAGLQPGTKAAYDDLVRQCTGCNLRQTSTTGGQHTTGSAHYQGLAIDIGADSQLNKFLTGSESNPNPCRTVTKTLGGKQATFLWEPKGVKCGGEVASSGDHWHMSVQP